MGLLEQLSLGSLFKDVQRMDKRQVIKIANFSCGKVAIRMYVVCIINIGKLFTASVPISELWYDCIVGANDLERFNGGHRQRITHRCRFEWQHGAGIPPWRSAISDQFP